MSLLNEAMEAFTILNKAVVDDGYGGTITVWTKGATIQAALVHNVSVQQQIAQEMGSTSAYTITVRKDIELDYHTVLKRNADDRIFRLTSNSDDKKTPKSAGLDMCQYTAEEWSLPDGQDTDA